MAQRFGQALEPGDPHLGRAERVHPGDDADAVDGRVRLAQHRTDLLRHRHDGPEHHLHGQCPGRVQAIDDGVGVAGDLCERLGAVEVLAAGDEPGFARRVTDHGMSVGGVVGPRHAKRPCALAEVKRGTGAIGAAAALLAWAGLNPSSSERPSCTPRFCRRTSCTPRRSATAAAGAR